ncbi:TIGR02391 family protein [Kineococcus arenarius]|uniref:TIGR02391 family protein n=1 Tax=Kineococcus sp. SYSU DK007 TaxID=3383128 RepID=UPI003D7D4276
METCSLADESWIDPELRVHVRGLLAGDDWAKVPATVAISSEDEARRWSGDPRLPDGGATVGKALHVKAFEDAGPIRLGRQASEWEGRRFLGVGFARAIRNVDRHRVQTRRGALRDGCAGPGEPAARTTASRARGASA